MKVRKGFVSNSSSSSFIISGEYDAEKVLKFAKEQTYKAEIKAMVDYALFDSYSKYSKKSRPIVKRIEHAKESLDRIACEIAKLDYSRLYINQIGNERGYGEGNLEKINVIGDSLDEFKDIIFLAPKDSLTHIGLKFLRFKFLRNLILEHPNINKNKCIKCGECAKICPPKTMQLQKGQFPKLKNTQCIRCWCCAEVCPRSAIEKSKRPLLGRILLKTDK